MTLRLDLPAESEARLVGEAERRGVSVDQLVAELVDGLPDAPAQRRIAFAAVGASGTGISDRIDDLLADGFGRS